ncbi:hypothetical protein C0581_05420 [Candidatus Parcubacteria bacterium]|nr:MAG: hypothetical protein C0581_05420 [Candidatus Parcubacteria bacterium]
MSCGCSGSSGSSVGGSSGSGSSSGGSVGGSGSVFPSPVTVRTSLISRITTSASRFPLSG